MNKEKKIVKDLKTIVLNEDKEMRRIPPRHLIEIESVDRFDSN